MISFNCDGCGKLFVVSEDVAGKRARCKACGTIITVPAQSTAVAPTPAAAPPAMPKMTVRNRRLMADAHQMKNRFTQSKVIELLDAQGEPPELYRIKFNVRSIERLDGEEPVMRQEHEAEIQLTADYPRLPPKCRLLTPIFHPNIDPTTICVGDHWAAGEQLGDLVVRIAEILAFQAYNIKSPLDAHAAMWADLHPEALPTDSRNMQAE